MRVHKPSEISTALLAVNQNKLQITIKIPVNAIMNSNMCIYLSAIHICLMLPQTRLKKINKLAIGRAWKDKKKKQKKTGLI